MKKTVYLTFDDGIQEGTDEVLKILKKRKVKASFFLAGLNCLGMYKYDRTKFNTIFSELVENHIVCNHSFSHTLEFYSSYYSKGLLLNGKRISPTRDFEFNFHFLNWLNFKVGSFGKGIRGDFLRLPGRNVLNEKDLESIDKNVFKSLLNSKISTKFFGWHEEWQMSFESSNLIRKYVENIHLNQSKKLLDIIPYINNELKHNYTMDRVKESSEDVIDRIVKSDRNKIILLMHDRAFRDYKNLSFSNDLNQLVSSILENGIELDTMDNFYK